MAERDVMREALEGLVGTIKANRQIVLATLPKSERRNLEDDLHRANCALAASQDTGGLAAAPRSSDGSGDVAEGVRVLDSAWFQSRVDAWMDAYFGPAIKADVQERCDRFIEEALEFVQAAGYSADRAHALVDYTFGRPQGEINQEVGGVMVTLAAMCNTLGVDIGSAATAELARVWTKIDKIRAKQASKPTGSALPVARALAQPQAPAAVTPSAGVEELRERLEEAGQAAYRRAYRDAAADNQKCEDGEEWVDTVAIADGWQNMREQWLAEHLPLLSADSSPEARDGAEMVMVRREAPHNLLKGDGQAQGVDL